MKYDKLGKDARKTIVVQFLDSVSSGRGLSNIGMEYIVRFGCPRAEFGSRVTARIKNAIAIAIALAAAKGDVFLLRTSLKPWPRMAISFQLLVTHWMRTVYTTEVQF